MNLKYPVSKPDITMRERNYVNQAITTGWISSQGGFVEQFEKLYAARHTAEHGVAVSSGTNALIVALRALGIKKGDEVIVPNFTMVATAWAVSMTGATPVFVDCDFKGLINPAKIEEAITENTKAIIPVHIYGRQCDMPAIMKIAHDYGLRVVEDSAEATGVPLMGDIACFSLYANKIITSGEGGICITNDPYLAEQMKHLRGMAFSDDHSFLHKKFAYNFRMTNLQAAVAFAQTERLDELLKKRRDIEQWYNDGLQGLGITRPERQVLWMYDICVSMHDRDPLREFLKARGIETRVFFKPMTQQPMYYDPSYYGTIAYKLSLDGLYLPTYSTLQKEEVDEICSAVRDYYHGKNVEGAHAGGEPAREPEAS